MKTREEMTVQELREALLKAGLNPYCEKPLTECNERVNHIHS